MLSPEIAGTGATADTNTFSALVAAAFPLQYAVWPVNTITGEHPSASITVS